VITKINNVAERFILSIVGPVFMIYIVAIFSQVVARNYIQISIIWLDEVARMCFMWTLMLGAAVAVRRQAHYVVEIVPKRLFWAATALKFFAQAAMLLFIWVMIFPGSTFAWMGLHRLSSALEIPWFYIYISLPIAGIVMAMFLVEIIVADIKQVTIRVQGK